MLDKDYVRECTYHRHLIIRIGRVITVTPPKTDSDWQGHLIFVASHQCRGTIDRKSTMVYSGVGGRSLPVSIVIVPLSKQSRVEMRGNAGLSRGQLLLTGSCAGTTPNVSGHDYRMGRAFASYRVAGWRLLCSFGRAETRVSRRMSIDRQSHRHSFTTILAPNRLLSWRATNGNVSPSPR